MEAFIYMFIGFIVGAIISWLGSKLAMQAKLQQAKDQEQQKYLVLDREFVDDKASAVAQIQSSKDALLIKLQEFSDLKFDFSNHAQELNEANKAYLAAILEPFGLKIADFKKKVEDVYTAESKRNLQRKSLLHHC